MTVEEIINYYCLEPHVEGGWFRELYTSDASTDVEDKRPAAGSIYYLLDGSNVSHFHQIDCEEIWYYHAGCGMKVHVIEQDGRIHTDLLGMDPAKGEMPMILIPKGAIFAAENMDDQSYTFVSCATVPKFRYEGFRLVKREELGESEFPDRLFV